MLTSYCSWLPNSRLRSHQHWSVNPTNWSSNPPQVSRHHWWEPTRQSCPQPDATKLQSKEADFTSFWAGFTQSFSNVSDTFQSDGPRFMNSTRLIKDVPSTWLISTLTPWEPETTSILIRSHGTHSEPSWLKTFTVVKLITSMTARSWFLWFKSSSSPNPLIHRTHFLMLKMKRLFHWKCLKASSTVSSSLGLRNCQIQNHQPGVDFHWTSRRSSRPNKLPEPSVSFTNFKTSTKNKSLWKKNLKKSKESKLSGCQKSTKRYQSSWEFCQRNWKEWKELKSQWTIHCSDSSKEKSQLQQSYSTWSTRTALT